MIIKNLLNGQIEPNWCDRVQK